MQVSVIHKKRHRIMCYVSSFSDNGESCFQVDDAQLDHDRNTTITKAEICFCDRDLCNNANPIPDVPTTTPVPGSAGHVVASVLILVITTIAIK
jgi:hypothetical protein